MFSPIFSQSCSKLLLGLVVITTMSGCAEKTGAPGQATQKELENAPDPAVSTTAQKPPKEVLNPEQYVGKVRMGYMAAKAAPEICEKLFCYCGCDYTDEHASLLDCFTSDHGVDCYICQEAAIMALKMKRKGETLSNIQKAVDLRWGKIYPFYEQPSANIKRYWATRLWAPGKEPTAAEKHDENAASLTPTMAGDNSQDEKKTPGCCGGKNADKVAKPAK